ncbi:Hypothetical protein, putative [Bodo saltans]|uniref:PH domain-containing protein n=1 Tax=Bodo saltans TaxID=75058 RepID=A0A0S4JW12_BODSA|nr:Hypothetical protein, putative [Bodo saltans]|eukprot:CUG93318.1 Hypothetical protein, putative [Bodo saltans]
MYVATSRQMQGLKDKVKRKLRIFNAMSSYERRHTRIRIRNGNEMTVQLFRSDSIHDEDIIAYYDLRTLQNVKNISIKQDEALPYLSFRDEEENSGGGGVAVTELVFGDIGLRLEFEESVSDGAHHRHGSGFGGGAGPGGGAGIGGIGGNGAAAELASKIWSPFDRVASAVVNEMNADGNTDASPNRSGKAGSAAGLGTGEGKSSKKLQKKLERKGKAVSLHLVFPTVQVREEWGHWFRVLMRHLELQRIAEQEIDPVTAMPIDPVDSEFVQRITDVRTSTLASAPFLKAVKDLTTKFMNLDIPAVGTLEPPNKGRLQARVPGYDHIGHYELSAWVQSGEIVLTPYRPKESIAKSLLNFHHTFRDAALRNAEASGGGGASSSSKEAVRKIRLTDMTLIRAASPWSCEFQIVLLNHSYASSQSAGVRGGGGNLNSGEVAWHFVAPNAEERKNFVEWLRLVKGRGTKSQTEAETYPYQFQGRTEGGGAEGDGDEFPSGELGEDFLFLDSHEGQRRRRLLKELQSSTAMELATAAAAAAVAKRERELEDAEHEDDDEGDLENVSFSSSVARSRRRSRSVSVVDAAANSAAAAAIAAAASAKEEAERQRKQHLTIMDLEYQAFRELREPYPSPRSDDTVHSVRRFSYFPGHRESIVSAYLDDVCAVHLVGRGERAGLVRSTAERTKAKRHWAYAEAARLRSPKGSAASPSSSPLGNGSVRNRRGSSLLTPNNDGGGLSSSSFALASPHGGSGGGSFSAFDHNHHLHHASSMDSMSTDAHPVERSILVQQLLVKRSSNNNRGGGPAASSAATSPTSGGGGSRRDTSPSVTKGNMQPPKKATTNSATDVAPLVATTSTSSPHQRRASFAFDAPMFASPVASRNSSFASAPGGWTAAASSGTHATSTAPRKGSYFGDTPRAVGGVVSPPSSSSASGSGKGGGAPTGPYRNNVHANTNNSSTKPQKTQAANTSANHNYHHRDPHLTTTPRPILKPGAFSSNLIATPKKKLTTAFPS